MPNTQAPVKPPASRPWQAEPLSDVLLELDSSLEGLSELEAARRLAETGPNELNAKPPRTLAQMAREQLTDPMILILLVAAVLSALLQEWAEAGIIFAIVMVNAVIGIVQERKAQSSLEALRSMSAPEARVVRDGVEMVVPARDLVPGDLVQLGDGSMAPADLRLVEAAGLRMQEAALTGESVPVEKDASAVVLPGAPLGDRSNMAFATAIVTAGRGAGIVVATGMGTEVGHIAGMLEGDEELDTPIKRKLASFGKILTIVGVAAALAVLAVGLAYGRPFAPLLLLAVSLAISVIPESLPATATITMALGVQRMARHEALVRRLPAVETLGGATVICTDKTGTLTENRMSVVRVSLGPDLDRDEALEPAEALEEHPDLFGYLAFAAVLCNDAAFASAEEGAPGAQAFIGDPTEGALLVLARDNGIDPTALRSTYPRLAERPFDSDRKRMSTVHERDGEIVAAVKGAIDSLLPRCAFIMDENGPRPMTDEDRARALAVAQRLSDEALRVLAFATRALPGVPGDEEDIERDLVLIGLVGMMDPPRPDVRQAVETCRTAGVRTVMITGDHASTARAIGRELDIFRPGDLVVTGAELDEMDDAALDEAARNTSVFARVSPLHKLRIVRALQHAGEVCAMTGDGVNDAPSIKAADIGVGMGITGTDVTKNVADMVLADDNFATIVGAVGEGRRIYDNIRKAIQFLLGANMSEVLAVFCATLFGFVILQPVHLLWVNLITDTLPALALGLEKAEPDVMRRPPRKASDGIFAGGMGVDIAYQGLMVAALTLAAYFIGHYMESGVWEAVNSPDGMTMAFLTLSMAEIFHAFNMRAQRKSVFSLNGQNAVLWASMLASLVLTAAVIYLPGISDAFGFTHISMAEYTVALGLALCVIPIVELVKACQRAWAKRRAAR